MFSPFKYPFISFILFGSLSANIVLAYALKKYYSDFRLATVFPTHEIVYKNANAQLSNKKSKRVVLFGDSRIQEWQNLPSLEGFEFVNRGLGGETTVQLRARFHQDVLDIQPKIVILQFGINDLVAIGVAPKWRDSIQQQCQKNIKFFVEQLQERKIEVILLSIIPPAKPTLVRLPVWSNLISRSVEEINHYWLSLPSSPYLHVIDTKKVLQDEQGEWHKNVNRDTLHLTSIGYEYLNQIVASTLKTIYFREALPHAIQ